MRLKEWERLVEKSEEKAKNQSMPVSEVSSTWIVYIEETA